MPCARRHSYSKRLTTSAAVALIGIAEHEALVQAIARKIHRGAAQVRHAFGIDKHMNAHAFHFHVIRVGYIHVLKGVHQTGATRGFNTDANAQAFAALASPR